MCVAAPLSFHRILSMKIDDKLVKEYKRDDEKSTKRLESCYKILIRGTQSN